MTSNTVAPQEMTQAHRQTDPSNPTSPQARPVCMIVLGMHRSGTSAFARVASLLGCDLPEDLMAGSEGNGIGHWESNAVVTLNDQLLASAGSRWDDWLPLNTAWSNSPMHASFLQRAVATLKQEYGDSPFFVLKDPRICRIASFWIEAIEMAGADVVVAMPVRNPFEVAHSLDARDGSELGQGLLLWLSHVLDAERMSRGKPRYTFAFEDMLRDWNVVSDGMERATGVVWPRKTVLTEAKVDEFLISGERHQRVSNDQALGHRSPLWVRQTYAILNKWCETGEDSADHAELDRIRSEFHASAPTFAQLVVQGMGVGEGVGEGERQRRHLQAEVGRLTQEIAQRAERPGLSPDPEGAHRIAAMGEEREGLLARLQALEEYSQSLQAELEASSQHAAGQAEHGAKQAEQAAAAKADAEARIAHLTRECEALSARQEDLQKQREELAGKLEGMAAREGEAILLGKQVAGLEGQILQLSSALRQREEEATQAWMELAAERHAQEVLREELGRHALQDKATAQRIDLLEERLHARTQALLISETQGLESRWEAKEATWRLELAETALDRKEEQLGRVLAEQGETLGRLARYETEVAQLAQFQMQLEQALSLHAGKDEVIARREADLESARIEKGEMQARLARYEREMAQLVQTQAQLEALVSESEAARNLAVDTEENRNTSSDGVAERIAQQHGEIAQLTRMAMEESSRARDMQSRAEWLQQFNAAQQAVPRWWALLPESQRKTRLLGKLERLGLFDASAYYARHADVAQSGMGALDHYLRHGIFEGRSW